MEVDDAPSNTSITNLTLQTHANAPLAKQKSNRVGNNSSIDGTQQSALQNDQKVYGERYNQFSAINPQRKADILSAITKNISIFEQDSVLENNIQVKFDNIVKNAIEV